MVRTRLMLRGSEQARLDGLESKMSWWSRRTVSTYSVAPRAVTTIRSVEDRSLKKANPTVYSVLVFVRDIARAKRRAFSSS